MCIKIKNILKIINCPIKNFVKIFMLNETIVCFLNGVELLRMSL